MDYAHDVMTLPVYLIRRLNGMHIEPGTPNG